MVCPKCGTKIPDKGIFCNMCGTKILNGEANDIKKDDEQKVVQVHKQLMSKKKKIISLIIVIVSIVVGTISIYIKDNNRKSNISTTNTSADTSVNTNSSIHPATQSTMNNDSSNAKSDTSTNNPIHPATQSTMNSNSNDNARSNISTNTNNSTHPAIQSTTNDTNNANSNTSTNNQNTSGKVTEEEATKLIQNRYGSKFYIYKDTVFGTMHLLQDKYYFFICDDFGDDGIPCVDKQTGDIYQLRSDGQYYIQQ